MKKLVYFITVLFITTIVISCSAPAPEDQSSKTESPKLATSIPVDQIFSFASGQLSKSVEQVNDGNRFPFYTKQDGTWHTMESSWWSSGFFAGCLWLMYEYTTDEKWKQHAVKWTDSMENQKLNRDDADIGYRMVNSFGNAYRLTSNEHYKEILIESARSLASRYNEKLGYVKAYDIDKWKFPVVVDHMMNIEIMFWAAKNGGDPNWAKMAETHGLNTMRDMIREDGSTIQVIDIDPETGKVLSHDTLCGLSGQSAWSRGQGEALYGFAIAYRETKNPKFLEASRKLADYFIDNLPDDHIPYWDFKAPDIPNEIRDASAASMAADGLLELCKFLDSGAKEKYYNAAVNILKSLCSPMYLAQGKNTFGIIDHATFQTPQKDGADTSLIFGDYNFLSALIKYKKGL